MLDTHNLKEDKVISTQVLKDSSIPKLSSSKTGRRGSRRVWYREYLFVMVARKQKNKAGRG